MITKENIEKWFEDQSGKGSKQAMLDCYRNAASSIFNNTASSPEQTLAVRKLQESVFWAFQAIGK